LTFFAFPAALRRLFAVATLCAATYPALGQNNAAPATPSASGAAASEETVRLIVQGVADESRQKELFDWLRAKDMSARGRPSPSFGSRDRQALRPGRQDVEAQNAQNAEDDNTTLALLNSFGHLGLQVFVDRQSPVFKRDLSGNVTLGDGQRPLDVLVIDASTRTASRRLSQQAVLTLSLAADPAAPAPDPRDYLSQLNDRLKSLLRDKNFKLAEAPQRGRSGLDFNFMLVDWERRSESIDRIGRSVGYSTAPPIVLVYNALWQAPPGHELLMFRHDEIPSRIQRQQEIWAAQLAELRQKLPDSRFERLQPIAIADLVNQKTQRLAAARAEQEQRRQLMLDRLGRIKSAAQGDGELAGALRIYRKDKPTPTVKPDTAFCSVKGADPMLVQGLIRSSEFQAWSGIPKGARFSHVFDTPDALYAAVLDAKCLVVADVARHLDKYMAALIRDQAHIINLGPVMNRQEAREPYAQSLGYDSADDLDLAARLNPVRVMPGELKTLRGFGVRTPEDYAQAKRRMAQVKYAAEDADVTLVIEFLRDDARGRQVGLSATQFRDAEAKREAAEAQAREEAARKERAQQAREFPYVAVLTCGMGQQHINILACFAAEGSYGVATELKLTNGTSTGVYKVYNLSEAGSTRRDGFYIDLRDSFAVSAQNSHGTLVLGIKIIDRVSGKVLYQDQAGKFGVLRVSN
jgi:hypothetical protein